jgi:hypothetical protein
MAMARQQADEQRHGGKQACSSAAKHHQLAAVRAAKQQQSRPRPATFGRAAQTCAPAWFFNSLYVTVLV